MSGKDDSGFSRRTFVKSLSAAAMSLATSIGPAAPESVVSWSIRRRQAERMEPQRGRHVRPRQERLSGRTTQSCLNRIERLNPRLNAFITVTAESALAQARQAETEIQGGRWRGPLHGVPIALKDLFDTAGVRTTAASELFKDRVPTQDGEIVRRLKEAGAILLGKLNMHEFAYGGSTVVSYYGPVHNPWSLDHEAGGSSSGSAVALAAGFAMAR